MTVADPSVVSLLDTLSDSLESATSVLISSAHRLLPPEDGISLLDVKNDLLLSYLQNLAFLILLNLRKDASERKSTNDDAYKAVVEKLIELRVYLERGVRPIEQRLKYSIDQYIHAAQSRKSAIPSRTSSGQIRDPDASDASSDVSDDSVADAGAADPTITADEASHAPRLTSLSIASKPSAPSQGSKQNLYRPPRVTPTAMPDSNAHSREPRKRKSQIMNEYIDEEMSTGPRAQPSIGSNNTILDRGRGGFSQRDLEKQRERTDYEERHFTRLPGESKSEKRKARKRGEMDKRDMFGGEDWTGLGGLGDRVSRSVAGGEKRSVLQRREKRRATTDLPRGDGVGIGESFEKRRRMLQGRTERKGRKGR